MCANDAGCGRHGMQASRRVQATGYRLQATGAGVAGCPVRSHLCDIDNKREHCIASQTTVRAQNSTAHPPTNTAATIALAAS